ncbi:MAG: site-specific integrase [Gammaproteobacteria bacterium]|jgi:site-specific recombinase XerD
MDPAKTSPTPLFDHVESMHDERSIRAFFDQHVAVRGLPDGAFEDYRRAGEFLYSYRGSQDTFASYRRELERLLQWSWLFAGCSLIQLKRADIEAFVEFCQYPPLAWIGVKTVSRFVDSEGRRVPNPAWRPFVARRAKAAEAKAPDPSLYSLSQGGIQAIFSVLSSFFNYLIQEEYVAFNPVAQIRQKSRFLRKRQTQAKIRRLSELQWAYVIETAEMMAAEQPEEHERTLFVMEALYGMYLRISELAARPRWVPQMGDFHQDIEGNWWFTTVGKGNKERDISVSDDMLRALKRYRRYLGLSELPAPGETTPLVMRNRGRGGIGSTRQIRAIVQHCFDRAVARMMDDGFSEDAESLKSATVHWLRHTGISDDVKFRPREHVRDDAGHGSSAITDRYIDVERRERHRSARNKRLRPE